MATLEYEVLHKNVYHFTSPFPDISKLMGLVETVNSQAVTPWNTWYADNTEQGYPYGEVKTLNFHKLVEEDSETKEKASYVLNTLIETMYACCHEFMVQHGADEGELAHLKTDMFEGNNYYGIRRYNKNEDMGPHQDRVVDGLDTYTISVYLDDDYDGGELGIPQPGVDALIKPRAGSIVVFPSGYLHESKLTTRGRKTIITHVHTTLKPIIDF
tara:strand:+ start:6632 stop:7273 length:642 start_codon:yes stop_codon:yes gene_type:complete